VSRVAVPDSVCILWEGRLWDVAVDVAEQQTSTLRLQELTSSWQRTQPAQPTLKVARPLQRPGTCLGTSYVNTRRVSALSQVYVAAALEPAHDTAKGQLEHWLLSACSAGDFSLPLSRHAVCGIT
jgi:hypothetical protein